MVINNMPKTNIFCLDANENPMILKITYPSIPQIINPHIPYKRTVMFIFFNI